MVDAYEHCRAGRAAAEGFAPTGLDQSREDGANRGVLSQDSRILITSPLPNAHPLDI